MSTTPSTNQQTVASPFPDLVDESLDEAAFLWRRWEGARKVDGNTIYFIIAEPVAEATPAVLSA